MAQRMALPADYESFGDGSNSAEPLFGGNTGYGPASMDGRSSANQTEYSLTPRFAEDVSNLEQYETPVDQFDFVHGRFPERLGDNIAPNLLGPGINRCQISFGNFNDLAADQSANNPESLYTLTGSSDDNGISRPQDMRHHHEPGITASIFNPDHGSNGTSQWDGGYCNLDDPFPFLWTPNETLDSEYVPPQRLTPRRPDVSASQLTTTSTSNNQSSRLLFQSSGAEISYLFHNRIDAQSYHTPAERSQNVQTASSSFIVASRDETFTFGPDISGPQLLQQSQYNPWSMELRPKNGSSQQSQLNSGLCPSHSFAETTRAQSDIFTIVHPHYTQHHAADRVAPVQVISATCSSTPNAYQGHVPIQPKSVKFGPSIPNNLRHVRSRQTRSDRRPLTKQGRENARAVKKMGGACILCKRNKLLVTVSCVNERNLR